VPIRRARPQCLAPKHKRRERLVQALQLAVVIAVGVLADREFFLVRVIAGIDADLFDVLHRGHRGLRQKVNVGHQRDMAEAGGGELGADFAQALGRGHIGRGDADDFATGLRQRDRLLHRGGDILRIAGGHRLQPDRMGAADADSAHLHFDRAATDRAKTRNAVSHGRAG